MNTEQIATGLYLRNLIGDAAFIKLVQTYRGVPIWIPRSFREEALLVRTVGAEAAKLLIAEFSGTRIYVPKLEDMLRNIRNAEIIERYNTGWSVRRLVQEYDLTERHIRRILGSPTPDDSSQLNLFA